MQEEKCLLSSKCRRECLGKLRFLLDSYIGPGAGVFAGLLLIVLMYALGKYAPRQSSIITFNSFVFLTTGAYSVASGLLFWLVDKRVKRNWCRYCRSEGRQICSLCLGRVVVEKSYYSCHLLCITVYDGFAARCVDCGNTCQMKVREPLKTRVRKNAHRLCERFVAWAHQPPKRLERQRLRSIFRRCR